MRDGAAGVELPAESRLLAAGFVRTLGFWKVPGGDRVLNLGDAVAALDRGEFPASYGERFPVPPGLLSHVRAIDESMRAADEAQDGEEPPEPPDWLLRQAEVIAAVTVEKLKPVIRAEVRAALKAQARKQES